MGDGVITNFMFATGIENSIPTINGGRTRVDEMESCGFYKHWRSARHGEATDARVEDADRCHEDGLSYHVGGPVPGH